MDTIRVAFGGGSRIMHGPKAAPLYFIKSCPFLCKQLCDSAGAYAYVFDRVSATYRFKEAMFLFAIHKETIGSCKYAKPQESHSFLCPV